MFDYDKLCQKITKDVIEDISSHYFSIDSQVTKLMNALGGFNEGADSLPSRLQEIKELIAGHTLGIQNVFDKFKQIEDRQIALEKLLESDRLQDIIKQIPTEQDIETYILRIEKTKIGELNQHLLAIKRELKLLSHLFG